MEVNKLSNEQFALLQAVDIVKTELREDWDVTGADTVMMLAYRYYKFLCDPEREADTVVE